MDGLSDNSSSKLTNILIENKQVSDKNKETDNKLNIIKRAFNSKSEWYDKYGNPNPGLLDYLFKF